MKDWKLILLATGNFLDNEYLDLYINLVSASHKTASYMESHHIIPVSYYKHKYNIDTSKHRHEAERYANADIQNETVLLSFADHCQAHWLLTKCTTKALAAASSKAFFRQIAGLKQIDEKIFLSRKARIIEVGFSVEEYKLLQQQAEAIKAHDPRFWTIEQDEWLKQNRSKHSAKYCANYLGKTESAIFSRCTQLGLKRIWRTDEEDSELLKYSETHTAKECAEYFGVSEHLIIKRWRQLGFSKTFKWTEEKDNWLRENDSKYTVAELAEKLGTTKSTVMGRRWTLGITRWERTK